MKVSLRAGFRRDDPVSPLDGVLRDCAAMGYDGIELMLDPRHAYGPSGRRGGGRGPWSSESLTPELREQVRESSRRHGVEIATLSADWAWGYAQYNPRLSQWERGVELLRSDVNLAADLGAKAMLMHVGESQGTWEEMRSIASRVAEEAARREVRVGFEAGIFARTGLGGLEELIKLVDELGTPFFGVYEHCYWPRRGDMQPHEEIQLVGQRMVALHSSQLNVQIDYRRMLAALKEVGYDSYWIFEVGWEQAQPSIDGWRYLMRTYA
ncbi:MAG: sugar phosphate isomerase/epimerase family protein [Chloroflexota bacterium]